MQGEDLDKLVAKIISGEVVLFAGSGLSLYAGYPSAWKLAADLLSLLDSEEFAESRFTEQSDLLDIAQVIEDLKGRDVLVNKISEIFGRSTVKNFKVHEMIVKIPFIRDIITTNYDYLFEAAYGPSLQAIVDTSDLGNINQQKVNLFKIHGDPGNPEAIVLTRDDYARFYRRNINTPLLSVIQERLTTKTVLFVGYSLQDINIRGEFMYALESLGTNAKEAYLVSPSCTKSNQVSLKKRGLNISVIPANNSLS
ncbi:SIR2 family NAD-dependent protein deacylase [Niabella hibiscisoli]|uniref:SIR2 family NAD-dependent protein deacylase n=1 Tax=Niabella hibiscisoli TaxID=1825928 RepID=UPI001F0E9AD2|nr:SIR2 family protein [Niabella hibiscisoli]MCH5720398.1 SIR2 family protein [Niabella hibiscisoli]